MFFLQFFLFPARVSASSSSSSGETLLISSSIMATQNEKLFEVREQKKKTVYDFIPEYTIDKCDLRYDELGHDFQISFKGRNQWELLDINSLLIELAQSNIEVTPAKLEIFLRSHFIIKFNPIEDYFRSLPGCPGR